MKLLLTQAEKNNTTLIVSSHDSRIKEKIFKILELD